MEAAHISVPSDNLASLRRLTASMGVAGLIHQVRIVVDSNWVLRDLRWLVAGRRDPSVRSALQEVIASGTVVAYAPSKLRDEVEDHIPDVAWDVGVEEAQVREEWQNYQRALRISEHDVPNSERWNELRDPTDLPFVYLYGNIGADAILTADSAIRDSGARVANLDVVLHLRDYSRAAAPEMTIKLGGTVALVVGVEAIRLLAGTLRTIYRGFAGLPKESIIALLVTGLLIAAHPRTRNLIMDGMRSVSFRALQPASLLAPVFTQLVSTLS